MPNLIRILYYLGKALKRPFWNESRLRKYQERKLRGIVKHAYDSVPFFHDMLRATGVTPSDVRTLEDLAKLPIIPKAKMRMENPRRLVSTEFNINRLKTERTSGSTGQPFTTYLTGAEVDWRKAIYMRANISCGQRPLDRWVVITSPHHFKDTMELQRKVGIYAQTCISLFTNIDDQVDLISGARPDVLDGYSGSLLLVAKEVAKQRLDTIKPRMVFGTADLIDVQSRRYLERVFEAPYYDQFGCSELDRTAWECPAQVGYHMDVDSVLTQFVDDEGEEVSPGERGEVVYTSLFNRVMPFIRYAVGDIGVPTDEKCPCGRSLPLMEVVEGRKDSVLVLPNGRLLSPMAFRIALSPFFDRITQYRVMQKKLNRFRILVKSGRPTLDEETLGTELVTHIREKLHLQPDEIELDIDIVDKIPIMKTGKLMAVVSELD